MPNQTTNPFINLNDLFENSVAEKTKITGTWFPIRIQPDLATGELLNIGVCFIDTKKNIHTKLMQNALPFKKLYGLNGSINFGFLLEIARDYFARQLKGASLLSISPHIIYGTKSYASGDSVQSILDHLYFTSVTIDRYKETDEDFGDEKNAFNTKKLTAKVVALIKERSKTLYEKIYHSEPIQLTKHGLSLEIPLFNRNHSLGDETTHFGVLCSVAYKADNIRQNELAKSYLTSMQASAIFSDQNIQNTACLAIYRPNKHEQTWLTQTEQNVIDNTLDGFIWSIKKQSQNIHIEVEDSVEKLTDNLLNKIAA